jgi:2-polyprenyl-3-methyl-5-hydroxy-6-metoxy-1,4-benzoquinol methylase
MGVTGEEFYKQQMAGKEADEHVQDYDALDQGPQGTGMRHLVVTSLLGAIIAGGRIMDLGCGTGLLLKDLSEKGLHPSYYVGVDFLPERRPFVERRLKEYEVNGRFIQGDITDVLSWSSLERFDAVTMVGVMGPHPFTTITGAMNLLRVMKHRSRRGIMSFPRQRPGMLGVPHQAHFDPDDVIAIVHAFDINVNMHIPEGNDLFIWW